LKQIRSNNKKTTDCVVR